MVMGCLLLDIKTQYPKVFLPTHQMIIYGNKKDWEISYNTHITNDVLGHLTEGEVDWVMIQVQEL
jgi:hypothetical protein